MDKDYKPLFKKLKKLGYQVENARRGPHYHISKDGLLICVISHTASDWRDLKNTIATLRRAGVPL